jgi:hypothetical protein
MDREEEDDLWARQGIFFSPDETFQQMYKILGGSDGEGHVFSTTALSLPQNDTLVFSVTNEIKLDLYMTVK